MKKFNVQNISHPCKNFGCDKQKDVEVFKELPSFWRWLCSTWLCTDMSKAHFCCERYDSHTHDVLVLFRLM